MIYAIQGMVSNITDASIVVTANNIGFQLGVAQPQLFTQSQTVSLFVYMHWSQELGPSLYGFRDELEKTVFLLCIGCPGIGPKVALAMLAQLGAKQCLQAIANEHSKLLSTIPGIGLKKAEQIIVNLRSKATKLMTSGIDLGGSMGNAMENFAEVSQALNSLRYTSAEVASAMRYLGAIERSGVSSFDQLMRQALSFLAKKN